MKVLIDGYAWLPKAELSLTQAQALKYHLTVQPRKVGDHPGEAPGPLHLFRETETDLGVPREFFFTRSDPKSHQLTWDISLGDKKGWPGDLAFGKTLRDEQQQALSEVMKHFSNDMKTGGIVRAVPGWGKTVFACSLIAKMNVPTLVIVHKEFLLNQWKERIEEFLPGAKVGIVQGPLQEWGAGYHVSIGMVHSLGGKEYPPEFYNWPGLIITDEVHRIGAATWAPVPPMFKAKYRLGLSATPRRKDGAEDAFLLNIGPIIFVARERRMSPKIRRTWTKFRLVRTNNFNPGLVTKNLLLKFLCASKTRNEQIIDQVILAVKAGRKVLVLSERLNHLTDMEQMLFARWPPDAGDPPSTGSYVGGMEEEELDVAAGAKVIFATSQFVQEGLDIPALDTIVLTTPLSDVEQAVGRILRPCEGKKEPIVVDIRDEDVVLCQKMAGTRDKFYRSAGWDA